MSGICPNCGQECTSRFCPNCGTRQPDFDESPQMPIGDSEESAEQGSEEAGSSSDERHQGNHATEGGAGDNPVEPEVGDDSLLIGDTADAAEVTDSCEGEDVVGPEDSEDDATPEDDAAPQNQDESLSDDGPSPMEDAQDVDETLISSGPEGANPTGSQREDDGTVSNAGDTPETIPPDQNEGPKLPDKTKRIAIGVAAAIVLVLAVLFSTHVIAAWIASSFPKQGSRRIAISYFRFKSVWKKRSYFFLVGVTCSSISKRSRRVTVTGASL